MRRTATTLALLGSLVGAGAATAQGPDFIYTDQTNKTIIRVADLDRNGSYTDVGEYIKYHKRDNFVARPQSLRFYNNYTTFVWAEGSRSSSTSNGVYVANLGAKTGRLNQSEATLFYPLTSPQDAVMDSSGIVYGANDFGTDVGLWRLEDLNNDGDAQDPGEANLWVGNTLGIQVMGASTSVTIGGDDFEGLYIDSRGWVLGFEQTDEVIYAFKDLNNDGDVQDPGEAVNFLNYGSQNRLGLLENPDLNNGNLPKLKGLQFANLEMIDSDTSGVAEIYYFGVYFGPSTMSHGGNRLGHIYRGIDFNQNGHLNDPGEVNLYYDGTSGLGVPVTLGEGMGIDGGAVYLQDADFSGGNNDRVIELLDANNDGDALDIGEQRVVFVDQNQPYSETMAVVPSLALPTPNSLQGQTTLIGTPRGGQAISFNLSDLDANDEGGTGFVALSLTGDGRNLGGINLGDGVNRIVPLDFDNLTVASLTALIGFFQTGTITGGTGNTPAFPVPVGIPVGVTIYAAGTVVTNGNTFGSITDAVKFQIQP